MGKEKSFFAVHWVNYFPHPKYMNTLCLMLCQKKLEQEQLEISKEKLHPQKLNLQAKLGRDALQQFAPAAHNILERNHCQIFWCPGPELHCAGHDALHAKEQHSEGSGLHRCDTRLRTHG